MNFRFLLRALSMTAMLLAMQSPMAADELAEVMQFRRQGQLEAALAKADQYLSAHPKDAQMRFAKATIYADANRASEAIAAFASLTQDHPELAEPYNNLAALYARAGDLAKAREALEQAIRLNPGDAVAHENLGDLYAALAAQSYATALKLDPALAKVQSKLAQVRQVVAPALGASTSAAGDTARR